MELEVERDAEAERARNLAADFHYLKETAKAADPESPMAGMVRYLNHQRRNELGRRRKRRRVK
jgi:hypothetical protein